ncbi:hypothetical protein, partial [Microbacterium sp. G2-8]|uniref:hypothetical protein n=1 Tax=Microbacterium sp. G2-8 TaxID=2842454 RepID=UPI001C8AE403
MHSPAPRIAVLLHPTPRRGDRTARISREIRAVLSRQAGGDGYCPGAGRGGGAGAGCSRVAGAAGGCAGGAGGCGGAAG